MHTLIKERNNIKNINQYIKPIPELQFIREMMLDAMKEYDMEWENYK